MARRTLSRMLSADKQQVRAMSAHASPCPSAAEMTHRRSAAGSGSGSGGAALGGAQQSPMNPAVHTRAVLRVRVLGGPRVRALVAAAALLQVGLLAWPLLMHPAAAQDIKVISSGPRGGQGEGCLAGTPGAPTNVKAVEKDGRVLLSWDPPAGGNCVDTYIIDTIDPTVRNGAPIQSSSTDALNTTVENLVNGRQYTVKLQAYSASARAGSTTELTVTPSDKCTDAAPGKPTNLRVKPGKGGAQVCWDGVEGDSCVDEFRVSAVRSDSTFRAGGSPGDAPVTRGGCANVSRLTDDVEYRFSVLAYSKKYDEGPAASVTAYVGTSSALRNGWRCSRMNGCRPSTVSACSLSSCAAVARMGGCKGPLMYDLDYARKLVTQWCAESCSCDISVAASFSPISWGVSSGLVDGVNSLLGMSPSKAPATPATAATATPLLTAGLTGLSNGMKGGPALPSILPPGGSNPFAGLQKGMANLNSGGWWNEPAKPDSSSGSSSSNKDGTGTNVQSLFGLVGPGGTTGGIGSGAIVQGVAKNVATSGVVGQTVGNVVGQLTSSVIGSTVNSVVGQLVNAFEGPKR